MVRYDGRGYGYFSLVKPDRDDNEEICPCGDCFASLCDCDQWLFDYPDNERDDDDRP